MLSAREIGLANGRPLAVLLDPLVPEPTPVSGDEDRDRCSPRLPFDEADLQISHNHKENNFSFVEGNSFTHANSHCYALTFPSDKDTDKGPVLAIYSHRETGYLFPTTPPCLSIITSFFFQTLSREKKGPLHGIPDNGRDWLLPIIQMLFVLLRVAFLHTVEARTARQSFLSIESKFVLKKGKKKKTRARIKGKIEGRKKEK
jgi:hypothetical protein